MSAQAISITSTIDNEDFCLSLHLVGDESKAEQQDGHCSNTKHVCNITNLMIDVSDDNNCDDDDIVGYNDIMMNDFPITTTQ